MCLDLSYNICLHDCKLASVNESMENTAPHGAIYKMGQTLSCIIHAFAKADADCKIFMAKWDMKDGFWWLDCEEGQEWNFCYILLPDMPAPPVS